MAVTGYAMALSTRVSNSLGAGCPRVARRATWVAVCIALALVRSRLRHSTRVAGRPFCLVSAHSSSHDLSRSSACRKGLL